MIPRSARFALCFLAGLCVAFESPIALASTAIVPDQWPTIQDALDSGVDTVWVRPGTYPETPSITRPLILRALTSDPSTPDSIPRVAGLHLDDFLYVYIHNQYITVVDFHFTGMVENTFTWNPYWNPLLVTFTHCALDSGFSDRRASAGGQLEYEFRDCTVDGPVGFAWPERVWFDDCLIQTPIVTSSEWFRMSDSHTTGSGGTAVDFGYASEEIRVERSTFEGWDVGIHVPYSGALELYDNVFLGPGSRAIDLGVVDGAVLRNTLRGFEVGLRQTGIYEAGASTGAESTAGPLAPTYLGSIWARDNRIEDCGTGMSVYSEGVRFEGNQILDCGVGASATVSAYFADIRAYRNVIQRCVGHGMILHGAGGVYCDTNVVGRCGGDGIVATTPASLPARITFRKNTSYLNGGAGYAIEISGTGSPGEIAHNIGYGNARHGLEVAADSLPAIGCNDWFGNGLGAIQGAPVDSSDLSVDPLFCDLAADDVSLNAGSPLADAAGCGRIGALGVGCGVTATLLEMMTVDQDADGVTVRWRFASLDPEASWLERAGRETGPWSPVAGRPEVEDGGYLQIDRSVSSGTACWYRIAWTKAGEEGHSAAMPFTLEPAPSASRLFPNPSHGAVTIEWTLAAEADVDVRVFDLAGREVAAPAHGRFGAGQHFVRWDGRRSSGAAVAAGWYVVRLRGVGLEVEHVLTVVR